MRSRRILITGVSSAVGGRLAQLLEREPNVEAIVGVDSSDPRHELRRTEFVRVDMQHELLRRIIDAAAIDTVIDTRLIVDPLSVADRRAHEVNVSGTATLLAACGGTVRKLVFKSSAHYYGCGRDDPSFFTEEMPRSQPPRTAIERDVVAVEAALGEFSGRHPNVVTTVLRVAPTIGADARSSHQVLLGLPLVPCILGFDPRCQYIHEDDLVGILEHAARHELRGTFNAAADGALALSEVASVLGKRLLPVLPPYGSSLAASQLRRFGLPVPVELIRELRFGRALDNRRLKATGYAYRYTSREAVQKLRAQQRLRPLLRSGAAPYQYEREVEEFLRRSPSVRAPGPPFPTYDDLSAEEVIEIVGSLDRPALAALRRYEAAHRSRRSVLTALDRSLAQKGGR